MKNKFRAEYEKAKRDLGISFEAPYLVQLEINVVLRAEALIRNFGASEGTLIFTDSESALAYRARIRDLGFTYSVMGEPSGDYDRQSVIEMLSEWGWTGNPEDKPGWLIDQLYSDDEEE